MLTINHIPTYLAWSFAKILPGTFKRNRQEFMHHDYPILAPLPVNGTKQRPVEGDGLHGPFIYFVLNAEGHVQYVGKSKEEHVLKRWIRPGNGGPAKYYWTHSTASGGCVFNIAEGLRAGHGPFQLRFTPLKTLRAEFSEGLDLRPEFDDEIALKHAERRLIAFLKPAWNRS